MSRPILGVALCTLLLSSTALAERSNSTQAKARRLTKYFKNAHGAVVNGSVAPHAKVTNIGAQGRFLLGLQGGLSLAKVVDRGMVHRNRSLYGGITFGIQVGAGPEVSRVVYHGPRGVSGKEMLPTRETSIQGAYALFGQRAARSSKGARGLGWDIGTYTGFGQGAVGRKVIGSSKPKKSSMLLRLEEGIHLSGEVNAAIRAGQLRGIGAKLDRMQHLREMIAAEKRSLNRQRRAVIPAVDLSL
jgi:hypothetical protein